MKFILTCCCLFCACSSYSQALPAAFTGHWVGDLHWYQQGKKDHQKIKMQLIIQPADSANTYTWQLIYGEKNEDSRPYLLKLKDAGTGHWLIDEKNGIMLDQYLIDNKLTGAFTVQSTTIINNYRLEKKKLIVEFYAISARPLKTSGGEKDVPSVDTYAVKSYQRAVLKKKK